MAETVSYDRAEEACWHSRPVLNFCHPLLALLTAWGQPKRGIQNDIVLIGRLLLGLPTGKGSGIRDRQPGVNGSREGGANESRSGKRTCTDPQG